MTRLIQDLHLLRQFVVVAELEHVGRAAKQLHISASPLSRRIQQLERELGLELFARERKRLTLTAVGRSFLGEARALLDHADVVAARAADFSRGVAGSLTIGFVEGAIHAGVLPRALRRFSAQRPQVRLDLRSMRSQEQREALQTHRLDVAFVHASEGDLCVDEPFVLAVPTGRPDVDTAIAVSSRTSPAGHAEWSQAMRSIGRSPRVICEVGDPIAALALAEAGVGVAMVQQSLARRAVDGVVFEPLPEDFPLRLGIACLTTDQPLARALADVVREASDPCVVASP